MNSLMLYDVRNLDIVYSTTVTLKIILSWLLSLVSNRRVLRWLSSLTPVMALLFHTDSLMSSKVRTPNGAFPSLIPLFTLPFGISSLLTNKDRALTEKFIILMTLIRLLKILFTLIFLIFENRLFSHILYSDYGFLFLYSHFNPPPIISWSLNSGSH